MTSQLFRNAPTGLCSWVVAMGLLLMFISSSAAASGDLSGVVTDLWGMPLPGATVVLKAPAGAEVGRTKTDADGRYQLKGVEPGQAHLTIEMEGFVKFEREVGVFEGTVVNAGMWVVPLVSQTVHVRGVVRDAAGKPLPSAAVAVAAALRTDRAEHGTADKRGRFDVVLTKGGWFMVIGSMPCYQPSITMVDLRLAGENPPDLTLTLQKSNECK